MSIRTPQFLETEDPAIDAHAQLVERIVVSQSFAKSARLSSFLLCVCNLARTGRLDEINEQYIGTKVFGRRPDYDPGVDSIVRSHASRLRHRLTQYFNEEGRHEEWILTIPKGSYLPVFQRRETDMPLLAEDAGDDEREPAPNAMAPESRWLPLADPLPAAAPPASARDMGRVPAWTLVAMTLIALLFAGGAIYEHRERSAVVPVAESRRLFWTQLFNARERTLIVTADSGLVMLQGFTKKRVDLPMYLNGTYLDSVAGPSPADVQARNMSSRRYTSVVDLSIMEKIFRMTGIELKNTKFVYSRDLRPNEIKQGNVILLGTYESTPWVQLFEPGMNFYFRNDLPSGVFSAINRNPLPGEQPAYNSRSDDPEKTVYGVVAYRPSLNGSSKVLILEGQSMAGTESASDFVFDDGYLLPFLYSIQRPDGTIPYFELLVRSTSMSGEASRLEIVAKRTEER